MHGDYDRNHDAPTAEEYSFAQLTQLRALASAYGHWYADHIRPDEDTYATGGQLLARLQSRAEAAAGPDALPMPVTVAGPPYPGEHHRTGSGRLQWHVDAEGVVSLTVWRPHPEVARARAGAEAFAAAGDDTNAQAARDEAREIEAQHPDGILVLGCIVDDGVVTVTQSGAHCVRHVAALRTAINALGHACPEALFASAVDLAEIAAEVRALPDADLVRTAGGWG